ncbi:uncharacterized protein LOC106076808 isoform X3 [Biomphalaria glabrata]|uniref:chitin synthase n=1 Tax=Biomphalaria glabrata TaxID=6526 RepID=A0A9W2YMH3_BIOGL|nr:uncharacterized protein LOC106076808 isoform X3 [Biomphalaria glabrata]
MAQPNSAGSPGIELTIRKQWKVERNIVQELTAEPVLVSKGATVAKWILSMVLGLALTCSMVVTKTSFVSLSTHVHNITLNQDLYNAVYISHFLVLYLSITVLYSLQLLRQCWHVLKCKLETWPNVKTSAACVLSGSLEAAGITLLSLKVIPYLGPTRGTFVMVLSLVVPIVCETWTSLRLNYAISMKIAYVFGCLCMLAGLGFFIYLEYDVYADQSYSISHIVHMVICLIILNFTWLPWLLKYISNSGYNRTRTNGGNIQIPQQVLTANCGANTQWKSSIILQTTKIIALFIFFFIFYFLDTDYHLRFDADVHSSFLAAWDFNNFISVTTWMNFILFLIGALSNYVLVWGIGYMNLCRWSLVVPVLLSLPFCVVIFQVQELCSVQNDIDLFCSSKEFLENKDYIIVTTVLLTLGQALVLARLMIKQQSRYMLAEKRLFWIPVSFSGTVDASLFLNCRDTISELECPCHVNWPSKILICTTMYRENAQEMRNVLKSLALVNICQRNTNTQFESHIFFDGGVNGDRLTEYSLQLVSLLEECLDVKLQDSKTIKTPFGLHLQWELPKSHRDNKTMLFSLNLKDNSLVYQRKRWSQVMYISYCLDFCQEQNRDNVYILMTDGDVSFTPQAIESLLDQISRDTNLGAVCARIIPEGMGPVVWYQTFEYSTAHWSQKTAEHVLGSVLCASGCFSVFRLQALDDVLAKYSTPVESSHDFLIKDFGEDRWLSTLLIQSGWKVKYCSDAKISSSCPNCFGDLYRQRRRWLPSTLTNHMQMAEEWRYISKFNNKVSVALLFYQLLLFVYTIMAPSLIILIISDALKHFMGVLLVPVTIQVFFAFVFIVYCLVKPVRLQIWASVIYTCVYILVMGFVLFATVREFYNAWYVPSENEMFVSELQPNVSLQEITGLREELPKVVVKKSYWCTEKVIPFLKKMCFCCVKLVPLDSSAIEKAAETILTAQDIIDGIPDEDDEKDDKTDKKEKKSSDKSDKATDKSTKGKNKATTNSETSKTKGDQKKEDKESKHTDESSNEDETSPKERKHSKKMTGKGEEKKKEVGEDKSKDETQKISNADDSVDFVDATSTAVDEVHWVQDILNKSEILNLEDVDQNEFYFWTLLKANLFKPQDKEMLNKKRLEQLTALRNGWLVVVIVLNICALTISVVLDMYGYLIVSRDNKTGIVLLVLLLLPTMIEFFSMFIFRISTVCSKLATAEYTWSSGSNHTKWSFYMTAVDSTEDMTTGQSQVNDSDDATAALVQP